jgi:methionine-rich copper-binding protein CopC
MERTFARPRRHAAYPLVVALAVVGLLALSGGPAFAHDSLKSTSPAASSTVATLPAVVTLTFNEKPLAPGTDVRVTSPTGAVVSVGKPTVGTRTVTQRLDTDGAPAGAYEVAWRVTSEDGHAVSGTFRFTAKAAVAPATATSTTSAPTTPQSTTTGEAPKATPTSATRGDGSGDGSQAGALIALAAAVVLGIGGAIALVRRGRRKE